MSPIEGSQGLCPDAECFRYPMLLLTWAGSFPAPVRQNHPREACESRFDYFASSYSPSVFPGSKFLLRSRTWKCSTPPIFPGKDAAFTDLGFRVPGCSKHDFKFVDPLAGRLKHRPIPVEKRYNWPSRSR